MNKKILSLCLCLILCLSLLPVQVFAEIESGEEPIVEEEVVLTEEPDEEDSVEEVVEESESFFFAATGDIANGEEQPVPFEDTTAAIADDEENVVEEMIVADSATVCDPDAENDNDALFQAYFEDLLMPHPRLRRPVGASNLTGVDLTAYEILADKVNEVAQQGGSTEFAVLFSDLGITKLSWTKAELGGIKLTSGGKITEEAKAAVYERLGINLSVIVSALQQDFPFRIYWYDKTAGVTPSYTMSVGKDEQGVYSISIVSEAITYSFSVSVDYGSDYTVDSAQVCRAQTAAENARAIVRSYAAYPDDEKLTAYKDEICALTSYNSAAAHGGYPYGDPWQPIYVFDGDPETTVVCEGYSKAFEYLCDMTADVSPEVSFSCISVTGTMDGGNHMWNIVTMADGRNYLADVTNSDSGTVGSKGQLFLTGYTAGNTGAGYNIACDSGSICYAYSDNTIALMTEEQLTIAHAVYWALDQNGLLTLSDNTGKGQYECSYDSDWLAYKDAIESLQINSGVTSIDEAAFSGCSNLKEVAISETLTSIGESAFSGCSALTNVTVLPSVRSVRKAAPEENGTSAAVTIPATVTSIGDYAFEDCGSLREIRFLGTPPSIGQNSFSGVTATAYYFSDHGWTDASLQGYGGWLIWVKIILYYDITIVDSANGTVTASVDGEAVSTAASGTTVTLTVSPDAGYELDSLTVTSAAGLEIPVTDNSFIMPAGGVTVTAAFKKLAYTITWLNDDGTELQSSEVAYGETPVYTGETPTKAASGGYRYTFEKWSPDVVAVTGEATYTATYKSEKLTATAFGTQLNMKGEIGMNIGVRIPEELMDGIYAVMDCSGEETRIERDSFNYDAKNDIYIFTVTRPAGRDRNVVTLNLYNADGIIPLTGIRCDNSTYTDSIYAYLKRMESHASFGPVATAMRNYCESTRVFFGYDPEFAPDIDAMLIDQSKTAPYAAVIPEKMPTGISYFAMALELKEVTALRVAFSLASGKSIGDYSFAIDGTPYEAVSAGGNVWYVELRDISSSQLSTPHAVSVTGGGVTATLTNVSALTYANNILLKENSAENLKQLVMSLYYYSKAADLYFA